jgi:hypothetical protein
MFFFLVRWDLTEWSHVSLGTGTSVKNYMQAYITVKIRFLDKEELYFYYTSADFNKQPVGHKL